jgi:hypothetical protein
MTPTERNLGMYGLEYVRIIVKCTAYRCYIINLPPFSRALAPINSLTMYKSIYPASSTESFPSTPLPDPSPSPSQYAQAHSGGSSRLPRCSPEPELVLQPDLAVTAHSSECDWETEDFTLDRHHPFGGKRLRIICRRLSRSQHTSTNTTRPSTLRL